jgi:hypothetical protein
MDRIVNQQENKPSNIGSNPFYCNFLQDHQFTHATVPHENHAVVDRRSSCGLPTVQQDMDALVHNDRYRHVPPWLHSTYRDSGQCHSVVNADLDWSHGVALNRPVAQHSAMDLLYMADPSLGSTDSGQYQSPHSDVEQHRSAHSHFVGSSQFLPDSQPPKVCGQMDRGFPMSDSIICDLPVNKSDCTRPGDHLTGKTCSDGDLDSNFACWANDGHVRQFSANRVSSDLYWSSHAEPANFSSHVHLNSGSRPFVQQFSVPSCTSMNANLSTCGFSAPSSADSHRCASSATHLQDHVQRCVSRADTLHDQFLSSQSRNSPIDATNSQFGPTDHRVHSSVKPNPSGSFSSGAVSQRSHVSYCDAARSGINLSGGGCIKDHKPSPVVIDASLASSRVQLATDSPVCPSSLSSSTDRAAVSTKPSVPAVSNPGKCVSAVATDTVDLFSKYGLDLVDEYEPNESSSSLKPEESTLNANKSASHESSLSQNSSASQSGAKVETPHAEQVKPAKKPVEKLFFDPRRIFATDKSTGTSCKSAKSADEIRKVRLGGANEDKHVGDNSHPTHASDSSSDASCSNTGQSTFADNSPPTMFGGTSAMHESSTKSDGLNNGKPVASSAAANDSFHFINNNLRQAAGGATDRLGANGRSKGSVGKESKPTKSGRLKHMNRQKSTNSRNGFSFGDTRPGKRKSGGSSSRQHSTVEEDGFSDYFWRKINGEHMRQVLGKV